MRSDLNILYDMSPVGSDVNRRTGLARVALELAHALSSRGDVILHCCAWGSIFASYDLAHVAEIDGCLQFVSNKLLPWERWYAQHIERCMKSGTSVSKFVRMIGQFQNLSRNPLRGFATNHVDCIHSSFARFHWALPQRIPRLITIHDITPLKLPKRLVSTQEIVICQRLLGSLKDSDHVVCVSQSTRNDILEATGRPEANTHVVYNGVDLTQFNLQSGDRTSRFQLTEPFVLTLSSQAPHKNLVFLLKIWEKIYRKNSSVKFVIAGGKGLNIRELAGKLGLESVSTEGIYEVGRVSDEEFSQLAANCSAFLFPSIYEGFGLPVLEAMACGAHVICSNRSSLPEIAGSVAKLIDPEDEEEWIDAIETALQIVRSDEEKKTIRNHATQFTWDRAASDYVDLYRKITTV